MKFMKDLESTFTDTFFLRQLFWRYVPLSMRASAVRNIINLIENLTVFMTELQTRTMDITFLIIILFTLFVHTTPKHADSPTLIPTHEEIVYDEGKQASIYCTISSGETESVTFAWLFNNKSIEFLGSTKYHKTDDPQGQDSKLRITNVSLSDQGNYTCLARNRFGQDRVSTKLKVKGWYHFTYKL